MDVNNVRKRSVILRIVAIIAIRYFIKMKINIWFWGRDRFCKTGVVAYHVQ